MLLNSLLCLAELRSSSLRGSSQRVSGAFLAAPSGGSSKNWADIVTIRVFDEARDTEQTFTCQADVLVKQMKCVALPPSFPI